MPVDDSLTRPKSTSAGEKGLEQLDSAPVPRPATTGSSRRPRYQSMPRAGGNEDDDDLFNFSATQRPGSVTSAREDFDDSEDLTDQDGVRAMAHSSRALSTTPELDTHTQQAVSRPSTTVGRRQGSSMWGKMERHGHSEEADSAKKSTDTTSPLPHPAPAGTNDDSMSIDFDLDTLLPDSASSDGAPSHPVALMPRLPSASHSSKGRSPSPSKPHQSPSPSTSPLVSGGSRKTSKPAAEEEVDIGFMPSFLEAGRETRSRRWFLGAVFSFCERCGDMASNSSLLQTSGAVSVGSREDGEQTFFS